MLTDCWLRRGRALVLPIALAALLLGTVGCKTQTDAANAATQMAATAQCMSSYYAALDQVLADTQQANDAQTAINGIPTIDLSDTRAQIKAREKLAREITTLSASFAKITGSTAAADASTAAGKLNDALVDVKALPSNSAEQAALTTAVKLVMSLLAQHDEIKAAKQLEPVCHALEAFFESESAYYDSINKDYLTIAKSNATELVKRNLVDTSSVFRSSLSPFSLTPAVDTTAAKAASQAILNKQIASEYDSKLAAAQKATKDMSAALKEMDARIALVTNDKALSISIPPVTLAGVESWIATVSK